PPRLHSFPTRRSSDLLQQLRDAEEEASVALKGERPHHVRGMRGFVERSRFVEARLDDGAHGTHDEACRSEVGFGDDDQVLELKRSEEHTSELQSRENL